MQAICLSRGVFPSEVLLAVLSCSVLIRILETGLSVALFSPCYSSHWETSFLTLSMLSCQDGSFLPEGPRALVFCCCLWRWHLPGLSTAPAADPCCVHQSSQHQRFEARRCIAVHYCVVWETHVGQERLYIAKEAESRNWVICQLLLLLPVGEWCSPVTALTHCASVAARHKCLSWKTKFTSWASDTIWIFIFFLMFN